MHGTKTKEQLERSTSRCNRWQQSKLITHAQRRAAELTMMTCSTQKVLINHLALNNHSHQYSEILKGK